MQKKYLRLLKKQFVSKQAIYTELINLEAILNLPKPTEHYLSDLHGEFGAFNHILNNCSGVIKDKIDLYFPEIPLARRQDLATLIYYPAAKLDTMDLSDEDYFDILTTLIVFVKNVSSKYTRSKVKKALPSEYAYIIDELLHMVEDEDNNQKKYHLEILNTIIKYHNADQFIIAICDLIKVLAVDKIHILGDIFDRGRQPHRIVDALIDYHKVDIQWGNHDVLWMGAKMGNEACILNVVRNCLRYGNLDILERVYGIPLRDLENYAYSLNYQDTTEGMNVIVNKMVIKAEAQLILKHPEYSNEQRHLGYKMKCYEEKIKPEYQDLKVAYDKKELVILENLKEAFLDSKELKRHVDFLFEVGSMYKIANNNLLIHGCIPTNEDGSFAYFEANGKKYSGKALLDYFEEMARSGYYQNDAAGIDMMWYLWCGYYSPLYGRHNKLFERICLDDEQSHIEKRNHYYDFIENEDYLRMVFDQFGLSDDFPHIINGHTPVLVKKGEQPIKANGKVIIIDGGLSQAYQKATGIAGYTLIYTSHMMKIKSHSPFLGIEDAIENNGDITSQTDFTLSRPSRIFISGTDDGLAIKEKIADLQLLLHYYHLL
ncbi:MAG: fructose-bisphosphatase class III [Erysipelotrichaceae bacterium]|nr:fructose-bisphosphatase class III [Erysipelotrichaceae bacterium]